MRRLLNALSFAITAVLGAAVCHGGMVWLLNPPPCARPGLSHDRHHFASWYNDFGLDFYVLRFGLFGAAEHIRAADVICSSSSKGLFAFDAAYLGQRFSQPGQAVKVYNLSFPCGEGFAFLMETIKTLDLHDKVLIADLTDNTAQFHFSPMADEAVRTTTTFEAYKLVAERRLMLWRDWLLNGLLPRYDLDAQRGLIVARHLTHNPLFRSYATGDLVYLPGEGAVPAHQIPAKVGHYPFDFHYDEMQRPFIDECRHRNIRIVFTSIPYNGHDPEYGRRVSERLGLKHVTVEYDGIEYFDGDHMCPSGRQLFSHRLADRLLLPDIDIEQRVADVRCRRQNDAQAQGPRPRRH